MGMEAANRWETEAIREARDRRSARPTVSQERETPSPAGDWRTLREASDETGIPIGTLRKWCRRDSVDSYLESDGEQTLRLLEIGSVRQHARAMGREPRQSYEPEEGRQATGDNQQPEVPVPSTADGVGTMIVPIDAWNKMLNQLGNLHEAGQQLAEARERAGKAETEAKFLRERLAEMRESGRQATGDRRQAEEGRQLTSNSQQPETGQQATGNRRQAEESYQQEPNPVPSAEGRGDAERSDAGGPGSHQPPDASDQPETTSFFRYVVRGWRGRKR